MQIQTRIVGEIAVVALTGRFVSGDATLTDRLVSLAQAGHARVVIDLANVGYMDSSGLGELIAGFTASRDAGGALKLLNVTSRVQTLLIVTKLFTIFETFTDEATAVASFANGQLPTLG